MSADRDVASDGLDPSASTSVAATEIHRLVLDDPHGRDDRSRARLRAITRERYPLLAGTRVEAVVAAVVDRLEGLGELEPLLADEALTDLLVTADGRVWVDRADGIVPTATRLDTASVERVLQRIVGPSSRRLDRTTPILDTHLADGSRVHVVVPPVSVDGPVISIRRFRRRAVGLDAFARPPVTEVLTRLVRERRNVLVTGATGAGKTTLLSALLGEAPAGDRILTVEDALELGIDRPHVVRLETRPPTSDGLATIDQRALLRAALRMRPDRLVVGEVRGPEAFDLVQAMLTGHDGSLATCHGRSAVDGLHRLESMMMMSGVGLPLETARTQLAAALDHVVHVARDGTGRRVRTVARVALADGRLRLTDLVDDRGER